MVEIGSKNWFFGSFWEGFCLRPLTPYELRPRFCQMKGRIKKHICGKFHQYSICRCKVKNFQSFLYWFSIHEMTPFWVFLGSYFLKYCSILLKFWPEFVSNKKNSASKILQNFAFWLKWDTPKVYGFGPFWGSIYCRTTQNIDKSQNFCKNYILRNIK